MLLCQASVTILLFLELITHIKEIGVFLKLLNAHLNDLLFAKENAWGSPFFDRSPEARSNKCDGLLAAWMSFTDNWFIDWTIENQVECPFNPGFFGCKQYKYTRYHGRIKAFKRVEICFGIQRKLVFKRNFKLNTKCSC